MAMSSLLVAFFVFPLLQGGAAAPAGDPQAGKMLWEGPATQCRNCHGAKGEGAFGPDLAGRKLTVSQFAQAVRKPWGIMPAFIDSQVSDREIADLVAYFDSLPAVSRPGGWRFEVRADAERTPPERGRRGRGFPVVHEHGVPARDVHADPLEDVERAAGCACAHGHVLAFPFAGKRAPGSLDVRT